MTEDKVVTTEEGQALADEYGIQFYETSAKNNIHVDSGFIAVAREVKERLMEEGGSEVRKDNLQLGNSAANSHSGKRSCC